MPGRLGNLPRQPCVDVGQRHLLFQQPLDQERIVGHVSLDAAAVVVAGGGGDDERLHRIAFAARDIGRHAEREQVREQCAGEALRQRREWRRFHQQAEPVVFTHRQHQLHRPHMQQVHRPVTEQRGGRVARGGVGWRSGLGAQCGEQFLRAAQSGHAFSATVLFDLLLRLPLGADSRAAVRRFSSSAASSSLGSWGTSSPRKALASRAGVRRSAVV